MESFVLVLLVGLCAFSQAEISSASACPPQCHTAMFQFFAKLAREEPFLILCETLVTICYKACDWWGFRDATYICNRMHEASGTSECTTSPWPAIFACPTFHVFMTLEQNCTAVAELESCFKQALQPCTYNYQIFMSGLTWNHFASLQCPL